MAEDEPPRTIDLRDVNRKAPDAFLPRGNPGPQESVSEGPSGSEKSPDEFEIRRKQFFGKWAGDDRKKCKLKKFSGRGSAKRV